jgi:hypothetical protein
VDASQEQTEIVLDLWRAKMEKFRRRGADKRQRHQPGRVHLQLEQCAGQVVRQVRPFVGNMQAVRRVGVRVRVEAAHAALPSQANGVSLSV